MRDATRDQYTQTFLRLQELREKVKEVWADCDLASLDQTLENIRWYRQFSK